MPEIKLVKYVNSVHPDEVAHHEPPHQDLHYLPCIFFIFSVQYSLDKIFFEV